MAGRFCKTKWGKQQGENIYKYCTRIFLGLQKNNETSKIEKTYLLVMILSGDIPDIMHQ